MARTKRASETEGSRETAASSDIRKLAAEMRATLRNGVGEDAMPDPLAQGHVTAHTSGLLSLDLALGIGGWPRARVNYLAGPKSSGKTTLTLKKISVEQARLPNSIHALVDVEQAYSESLAHLCEVNTDPDRFIVVQPHTAEDAFKACMMLMGHDTTDKGRTWEQKRQGVSTLVYDSWAGSPTEEVGMATLARVGAMWWPKMTSVIRQTDSLFFVINQIRLKPGVVFGNPEYEPGGEALQHAISMRATVHKVEVEKNADKREIGHMMKVKIGKNKVGAPGGEAKLRFNYYTGFDYLSDAMSVLDFKKVSLKEKPDGNVLVFIDPESGEVLARGNGEKAFLDEMRTDPDTAQKFLEYARQQALGVAA